MRGLNICVEEAAFGYSIAWGAGFRVMGKWTNEVGLFGAVLLIALVVNFVSA